MSLLGNIPLPKKGFGCQQLLSQPDVVHHGILRRRSVMNKMTDRVMSSIGSGGPQAFKPINWPRRYVILYQGCLYMFKDETASKPTYAVSLYGYHSIERCPGEAQNHPWPFKVVNALNDKENTIYFSSPTEKDMQTWITHLEQQLVFANGFNAASSLAGRASQSSQGESINASQGWQGGDSSVDPVTHDEELEYMSDDDADDDYDQILDQGLNRREEPVSEVPSKPSRFGGGASYVGGVESRFNKAPPRPPVPGDAPPVATVEPKLQGKPALSVKPSTVGPKPSPGISPKPSATVKPNLVSKTTKQFENLAVTKKVGHDSDTTAENFVGKTSGSYSFERFESSVADDVQYSCGPEYTDMGPSQSSQAPAQAMRREKEIENAYWNRGAEEADKVMKTISVNGAYMIRASQEAGAQTLLVRADNAVRKYRVRCDEDDKYSLAATAPVFDTLALLISYYKVNTLPQQPVKLTRPFSTVWKG